LGCHDGVAQIAFERKQAPPTRLFAARIPKPAMNACYKGEIAPRMITAIIAIKSKSSPITNLAVHSFSARVLHDLEYQTQGVGNK
jgi:hypothetical protein